MPDLAHSALGLLLLTLTAWALSAERRAINPRRVLVGVGTQLLLGALLLRAPGIADLLLQLNGLVRLLDDAAGEGARFMFGYLAGGEPPWGQATGGSDFIVAFRVLPLVLVVSALSSLLFHVGVLPAIIRIMAKALRRGFRVSGALGFGAAASIFMGIIEGPLLVRPYLATMTRSDLFALMVCGMSTVAGTVMVLYASVVEPVLPGALGNILVASVISVPAALTVSHLMLPGTDADDGVDITPPRQTSTAVEAVVVGTSDGLRMVLEIAATIVVLFALVHLVNAGLGLLPDVSGAPLSMQRVVGFLLRPFVWMTGIPWTESAWAAERMGTKTVLNEFVAYLELAAAEGGGPISEHSRRILVYAMCGFANLGSLGILAGGLGSVVPARRTEIVELGFRALIAGTLATLMTGAVAGLLT